MVETGLRPDVDTPLIPMLGACPEYREQAAAMLRRGFPDNRDRRRDVEMLHRKIEECLCERNIQGTEDSTSRSIIILIYNQLLRYSKNTGKKLRFGCVMLRLEAAVLETRG